MTKHRSLTRKEIHTIINEEIERIDEIKMYHRIVIAEARRLRYEGCSRQTVNEGVTGMLTSIIAHAPEGVVDMFKINLIRHIQIGLGFSPDSFLGRVSQNLIEAITLSDLPSYFGPQKCDKFADMFIEGISETLAEPPGNRVAIAFGFNPAGALWLSFRESITNALLSEDGPGGQLKDQVKTFVCNVDFEAVTSGAQDAGERVRSAVTGTPGPPDDYGSGISQTAARMGLDD